MSKVMSESRAEATCGDGMRLKDWGSGQAGRQAVNEGPNSVPRSRSFRSLCKASATVEICKIQTSATREVCKGNFGVEDRDKFMGEQSS